MPATARRPRSRTCWPARWCADPLRLLDICATSDGAAALIVASTEFAEKHLGSLEGVPSVRAVSTVTPRYPQHLPELPDIATDSTAVVPAPGAGVQGPDPRRRLRRGRHRARGPRAWPRSTTCPPRWNSTGTSTSGCAPRVRPRSCCAAARRPIGGRVPVNPSGGLACFGEAIPAQAIAQVCELTWQLQGQATGRQVEGAKVGVTANQGLFGHGSSVIVAR